jgi:phosphotransacetylase
MNNVLNETAQWFVEAVREPTEDNKGVQIGVHIEEFAEMLEAIGTKDIAASMHEFGNAFKTKKVFISDLTINRKELLDSLADQVVTATGIAHMFGLDLIGALSESKQLFQVC